MKQQIERALRGKAASCWLEGLGIHPVRFWLLMDLFAALSESGEATSELGRNSGSMKMGFVVFCGISCLLSLSLLLGQASHSTYLISFLLTTGVLLLQVLLSETGNSLLNPAEGMVLAHQPINGATYTAAKLAHLLKVILFFVPGINAIPALVGLFSRGAAWYYPFVHLTATLALGVALGLGCCGFFGWLLRFVPAKRLKAASQFASGLPFLFMMFGPRALEHLNVSRWLPAGSGGRWGTAAVALGLFAVATWMGLRSLSADYLVRVHAIGRGGTSVGSKWRSGWTGTMVSLLFGGQAGRAGFAFVSKMMLRDWQFRRQLGGVAFMPLVMLGGAIKGGWRTDPFSGHFAVMQVLPHVLGSLLFFICLALPYGNDYKGSWIFQLAPATSISGFARGVHAALWLPFIAAPHLILLPLFAWNWGLVHAALFIAFSMAASSTWLALEMRRVEGIPFSRQLEPSGNLFVIPLLMLGSAVAGIAVALQHFLIFRWPAVTIVATLAMTVIAVFATRSSLDAFSGSIRYRLSLNSGDGSTIYKEIGI